MDKEMRMKVLVGKLRLRPHVAVKRAIRIAQAKPDDPMSMMMLENPEPKTAYHLILRHSPLATEYWDINAPTDFLKYNTRNEQSSNTKKGIRPPKAAGTERHNGQRPGQDWPTGKIDRSGSGGKR